MWISNIKDKVRLKFSQNVSLYTGSVWIYCRYYSSYRVVQCTGDRFDSQWWNAAADYFSLVMVSLLGPSAVSPACYGGANIQWLLINVWISYSTHTEKKTNMPSPLSITVIKHVFRQRDGHNSLFFVHALTTKTEMWNTDIKVLMVILRSDEINTEG